MSRQPVQRGLWNQPCASACGPRQDGRRGGRSHRAAALVLGWLLIAAGPAAAADAFAEWVALMREVARAEGQLSDLRQDRDEALARLQAGANRPWQRWPPAPEETADAPDPQAERAAVAARYAQQIAAAEARLAELQRRAQAARPGPTFGD